MQNFKLNLEQIEKGGYDHLCLKKFYEQPQALEIPIEEDCLPTEGLLDSGVENHIKKFTTANRIILLACGTSWHAGLVAEYIFEDC